MAKQTKTNKTDPRLLFGSNIARLRKEIGLSQEQLALESGLARSYMGGVERGQRNIALINICKLADALNIEPSELLKFS
jgi:transcriptional regulator with XRE-family HTH domain